MLWLETHDELLCREVILIQPYAYRVSTRERGNAWSQISEVLNTIEQPKFYVSQRSVRERFALILTRFRAKNVAEQKASGIAVDPPTPTETLLEEIDTKIVEFDKSFQAKTDEINQKNEHEKKAINDIRMQALETLSETNKRKEEEGEDTKCSKRKRQRSSGSDTIAYLREKSAKDYELELKKLEARKEEAKTQQQLLQQQQQSQQAQHQQMMHLMQIQQQSMITLIERIADKNV